MNHIQVSNASMRTMTRAVAQRVAAANLSATVSFFFRNATHRQALMLVMMLATAFTALGQSPSVSAIYPRRGGVGTTITISGANLAGATGVQVNGTAAVIVGNTATEVLATVMPGTASGQVVVTTGSGSATSPIDFTFDPAPLPTYQQGSKLIVAGTPGAAARLGRSIALSANGNTMAVGAPNAGSNVGSVSVFVRNVVTGVWSLQQTLIATGYTGTPLFGVDVTLSADGNTLAASGSANNSSEGGVWVFTRSGSTWSQQGGKLLPTVGQGAVIGSNYSFGSSVVLSLDGNTLYAGANGDSLSTGAVWTYTRSGGIWSVSGSKIKPLVGGAVTTINQSFGTDVAVAADGNTLIVGAHGDSSFRGAVWVYNKVAGNWNQQALLRPNNSGAMPANTEAGRQIAISANGNIVAIGVPAYNTNNGAVAIFSRSGSTWTQQQFITSPSGAAAGMQLGSSVAVAANGSAIFAGAIAFGSGVGGFFYFNHNGSTWVTTNGAATGTGNNLSSAQGYSIALSHDYQTLALGGPTDSTGGRGAVWAYSYQSPAQLSGVMPTLQQSNTNTGAQTGMMLPSLLNGEVKYFNEMRVSPALPPGVSYTWNGNFYGSSSPALWQPRVYNYTAVGTYGHFTAPVIMGVSLPAPLIYYPPAANRYSFNTGQTVNIAAPLRNAISGNYPQVLATGVQTFAGTAGTSGSANGLGAAARFNNPTGIVANRNGVVFVADYLNHVIRRIDTAGNVTVFAGQAGTSGAADGLGTAASFNRPHGLTIDTAGNIYVADEFNNRIRKIDPAGNVTTVAGSSAGYADGQGSAAQLTSPTTIAVDLQGNLYVTEWSARIVRKIDAAGNVTTFAGAAGVTGTTNGPRLSARFSSPHGIAVDPAGNVYVADNHAIRLIDTAGAVTTYAGAQGASGFVNGVGAAARFNLIEGLTADSLGNIYATETGNHAIRKIVRSQAVNSGVVTTTVTTSTLAGTGSVGSADNTTMTSASFNSPHGLFVDQYFNLVVADYGNHTVRTIKPHGYKITPTLPAGLSLHADGTIQGTPTATAPVTLYSVSMTNHRSTSIAPITISVMAGPVVTNTLPTRVVAGTLLNVIGTNLDGVEAARIGTTPAIIVSRSATLLKLVVNEGTTSGTLTLTRSGGDIPTRPVYISANTLLPLKQQHFAILSNTADRRLGGSVAVSADGNTVLAGAPRDSSNRGRVYVYTRVDTVWSATATQLISHNYSGSTPFGRQGSSVALSADGYLAAVGGNTDSVYSTVVPDRGGRGAVWVWSRGTNNTWTEQTKIVPTGYNVADTLNFGASVGLSADGTLLAVGAPNYSSKAGAVYVYRYNGSAWQQEAMLTHPYASGGSLLGSSVAVSADGSKIVAGAPGRNGGEGMAVTYYYDGGIWNNGQFVLGTLGAAEGNGTSVAITSRGTAMIAGTKLSRSVHAVVGNTATQATSTYTNGGSGFGVSVGANADGTILTSGVPELGGSSGTGTRPGGAGAALGNPTATYGAISTNNFGRPNMGVTFMPVATGTTHAVSSDGSTAVFGAPTDIAGSATAASGSISIAAASNPTMVYDKTIRWYAKDALMDTLNPVVNGTLYQFSITPAVPAGMTFDTTSGVISGTPTANSAITTYYIEGRSPIGRARDTIRFGVKEFYSQLGYPVKRLIQRNNTPLAALTPSVQGSIPASFAISPTSLPTGLNFNTTTGVLSGTPTQNDTAKIYTITATTALGYVDSFHLVLEVNDTLRHTYVNQSIVGGTAINVQPAFTGGGLPYGIKYSTPATFSGMVALNLAYNTANGNIALVNNSSIDVRDSANITSFVAHNNIYNRARDAAFLKRYPHPVVLTTNESGGLGNALFFSTAAGAANRKLKDLPARPRTMVVAHGTQAIYVALEDHSIVRLDVTTGLDSLDQPVYKAPVAFAGLAGTAGYADGTGTVARFNTIMAMDIDSAGNLFVADRGNNRIRKITPQGVVSTFIGNGGTTTVNGTGSAVSFAAPTAVAVDGAGNVYVGDNNIIRRVSGNKAITIATASGVVNDLLFAKNNRLLAATASNVQVMDVFGNLLNPAPVLRDGLLYSNATQAYTGTPSGIDASPTDSISTYTTYMLHPFNTDTTTFTLDYNRFPLRGLVYTPHEKMIPLGDTVRMEPFYQVSFNQGAVTYSATGLPAWMNLNPNTGIITGTANAVQPRTRYTISATNGYGAAQTAVVTITVAELPDLSYTRHIVVRRSTAMPAGTITPTVAGGGVPNTLVNSIVRSWGSSAGTSGNVDGNAATARFASPTGIAADRFGNIYIADMGNQSIRRINPQGVVSTIATNIPGMLSMAVDDRGRVLANSNGQVFRLDTLGVRTNLMSPTIGWNMGTIQDIFVQPNGKILTAAATNFEEWDSSGNRLRTLGAAALGTIAVDKNNHLWSPESMRVANANSIGINPSSNYIRRTQTLDWAAAPITIGSTRGGITNPHGFAFDICGTNTFFTQPFNGPGHVFPSPTGYLYIADFNRDAVRAIDVNTNCLITQFGGLSRPFDIAANDSGYLFVTEHTGNRITQLSPFGYSVANLPAGLNLNADGTITGTPGANMFLDSMVTVTGRNMAGIDTFQLRITVGDAPFGLAYPQNSYVWGKNFSNVSEIPTVTHIPLAVFTISPSLPAGLSFNAQTGEISGMPTATLAATSFRVIAQNVFGSDTADISIEVGEPPVNLSYGMASAYTVGTSVGTNNPTVSGGAVVTYSLAPALPSGIAINSTTGIISGTPSASALVATYAVTATNQFGFTIANITFQVDGPPHSLSYPSPALPTIGQSMIPLIPSVVASPAVTGYTISGTLPAGLTFNNQTGVISGVPTAPSSQQQFVITASNGVGSTSFTLTLIVNQPPIITYPNLNLPINQGITPVNPTNLGGPVPSSFSQVVASTEFSGWMGMPWWQGLAIDPSGNAWIGTDGSDDVVRIAPNGNLQWWTNQSMFAPGQPVFTPTGRLMVITANWNTMINELDINVPGSRTTITNNSHPQWGRKRFVPFDHAYYSVDDNEQLYKVDYDGNVIWNAPLMSPPYLMPQGLGYDYQNHLMYVGGPGYVVSYDTSGNQVGSWGAGISDRSFADGGSSAARIGNAKEVVVLGDKVVFWDDDHKRIRAIDIPTGDIITVAGDGTAAVTDGSGTAIQLSNVRGMTTHNGDLYVLDDGYVRKISIQSAYTISPALPAGLSYNPQTGEITGTPTAAQTATTYTAVATNSLGSSQPTTFTITIGSPPSGLSYPSPITLMEGQTIALGTYLPTVNNNPTLYSISPAVPNGVFLDTVSGELMGTPAAGTSMTAATYRIKAFNAFGVDSVDILLDVEGPVRNLTYGGNLVFANGSPLSPVVPTYFAHPATTSPGFQISAALPAGLSLNNQTGIITGTPSGGASTGTYSVWVSNGILPADTVTFTITITQPPMIQYTTPQNYTVGQAITPLNPTVSGSPGISFGINPALPAGLGLNSSTGAISGTPTAATNPTTYTVTATNQYGSATFQVVISTGTPPVGLSYGPGVHSYKVNAPISPALLPTAATGTGSISYTISPTLPTGMAFNAATGAISGTPTIPTATATYTVTATSVYGSVSATVQLQTGNPPSALSYNTPNVFTEHVTITPLVPTVTDTVGLYVVSPTLPAGLSLNPTTGVISGTPTTPQLNTSYVVTASNVFGSTTDTVDIAVLGVPTNISYGSQTLTFASGVAATPVVPAVSANPAPTQWTISPATMPAGLVFNTTTGAISGTPTGTFSTNTYQVTATNSVGTSVPITLTIVVTQAPVNLTYTSPNNLVVGTAIAPLNPTVSGAQPMTFSVQPGLPAGLSMNGTTGVISGTPTTITPGAWYLTRADNQYGFDTVSIWIATGTAPSGLQYPSGVQSYRVGTSASLAPTTTATGSGSITYTVSPSLPAGMSINPATGVVTGVPATPTATATYTVTATSVFGSTTATVQLQTGNAPSALSYNTPNQVVLNTAMAALNPTVTDTVGLYSISPALPAGIAINAATGVITGMPTGASMQATSYTVTASNVFGSTSFTLSIEVLGPPTGLTYPQSNYSLPVSTPVSGVIPTVTSNPGATFSISQPLPAGLSFNPTTGAITGTPTTGTPAQVYTVTATNQYGSTSVQVTIGVASAPANLSYASPVNLPVGTPAAGINPTVTGTVTAWSISGGTLPAGLLFNTNTGQITGTPTVAVPAQQFTVTATNQFGSTAANLVLATGNAPSGLSYGTTGTQHLAVGTTINPMVPTANTGTGTVTYTVSPALPPGMTFNPNTGAIGGTPTTPTATGTYTVTVTNPFGSVSTIVSFQAGRAPSALSYNTPNVFAVNTAIGALSPTVTDTVGSYSISPALPAGLVFNTTTGVISGTPTLGSLPATYTVTATNVFGSTTTTLSIEVQSAPTGLVYNIGAQLQIGVPAGPFVPTVHASPAPVYTISPTLPPGMTFNGATGAISGTPTALSGPVTYTVTATNNLGATSTTVTFSVVAQPPTNLVYSPAQVSAMVGTPITTMTPSVQGGAVTAWSISPGLPAGLTFNPATGVISGTLTNQQSGMQTYTVTASNSSGSVMAQVTISYTIPSVIAPLSLPQTVVYGSAPVLITAPQSNNPAQFTYSSSNSGVATVSGNTVQITGAGTVTITASQPQSGSYLPGSVSTTIIVAPAPLTLTANSGYRCVGTANGVISYTATGFVNGEDSSVFTVQPTVSTTANQSSGVGTYPVTVNGAQAANYTITYQGGMLTVNAPQHTAQRLPTVDAIVGESTPLQARTFGTAYQWSPATGLSNTTQAMPYTTLQQEQQYTIAMAESTGCVVVDTLKVRVFDRPDVFVPSLFSPNGDGINDVLRINPVGMQKLYYFRIFNKWGTMVYMTTFLQDGWDGRYRGALQNMDSYTWILSGLDKNGKNITRSGSVTLVR